MNKVVRLWRRLVVVAGVSSWVVVTPGVAWGELRWLKIGEGGLSWNSQKRSLTAVDFTVTGAIQTVGFEPNDNIVQRLRWAEVAGEPADKVAERAEALIWDNVPLKLTSFPTIRIVDGDSSTSTETRFKRFGVSQAGTAFSFDLGSRFPANRIVFFPRQTGQDAEGRLFKDDFIRGYEILVNDGLAFSKENQPIYTTLRRVEFNPESLVEVRFPLQFIRYIRLNVTAPNPFEIAEFQVFGAGFAPKGEYLSKVVDLGAAANYGRLEWTTVNLHREGDRLIVAPDADAGISIRMRTGTDDTPYVYHKIVNAYTRELQEVSEAEYTTLSSSAKGPVEDDQVNWSFWSLPFTSPGERIDLPGPRRFFQFWITLESRSILDGMRVASLAVEHAIPPLAQRLVGEVSLLDVPRPPGGIPVVPAGVVSEFAYDIIADIRGEDVGFDAIRVFTPSQPKFTTLFMESPPRPVVPDSVEEASRALTLFFPSHRVTSQAPGVLRVVFEAQVFMQGTFFNAEVFDTRMGELPQMVLPGDANPDVETNTLRIQTSAQSMRDVFPFFEVTPQVFSPNGDGRNDTAAISYTLVQLVRAVGTEVEVFDLAGRKVRTLFEGREGSGSHTREWDGRDDGGTLLPVGVYLVRVSVHAGRETLVQTGTVAMVY